MDLSRRLFLGISATGALTLYSGTRRLPVAVAAVAGGTLDPGAIPKFVTPLLVPPAMPRKGTADGSRVDTYELSVRQISQQILPAGMPRTTVWAYGPVLADGSTSRHHAPSYTVETRAGRPVRITWVNGLVDRRGHFLPHLLPVDPSLHWANPQKLRDHDGRCRTDSRPALHGLTYVAPQDFSDPGSQYTCYRGPVPWVTHLHGAVDVPDDSDG